MRWAIGIVALVVVAASSSNAAAKSPLEDLPRKQQVRVACSIAASLSQGIPTDLLIAVAELEGGKAGQWVRNRNGTYDVGAMQLNTRYLAHLQRQYGITAQAAASAGCYPFELAAWRLKKHLTRDKGGFWRRAANYHSRTPRHNRKYRKRLQQRATRWRRWLRAHFPQGALLLSEAPSQQQHRAHSEPATAYAEDPDAARITALIATTEEQPSATSRSVGKPHHGRLEGAVQIEQHPAYAIRNRARAWATGSTARWLRDAFDAAIAGGPRVQVLDASLHGGGQMRGHNSHQSGRDVDLTYYRHECRGVCDLRSTSPKALDATRQWAVLRRWLVAQRVEFIFIDYGLQGALYAAARRSGASPAELRTWFQFPNGPSHRGGIIRHVDNHRDHLHVRFRCRRGDGQCRAVRPGAPGVDVARVENEWTELLSDGDEDEPKLIELLK